MLYTSADVLALALFSKFLCGSDFSLSLLISPSSKSSKDEFLQESTSHLSALQNGFWFSLLRSDWETEHVEFGGNSSVKEKSILNTSLKDNNMIMHKTHFIGS